MTSPEVSGALALKFTWAKVDRKLLRRLLLTAYADQEGVDDAAAIRTMAASKLSNQGTKTFGRPPKATWTRLPGIVDVLRKSWLPTLAPDRLDLLVRLVQLSLTGDAKAAAPSTRAARVRFLRERNKTGTFCDNLHAAFVKAHKERLPVGFSTSASKATAWDGRIELAGLASPNAKTAFPHQQEAWTGLDALWSSATERRAGLLVLPTGSGKTFTIVHWLMRRMNEIPDLRVLWLADQRELLTQASRQFAEQAEALPNDFQRQLRVMHGGAGPASALADPDLDIACMTRQSLIGKAAPAHQKQLAAFLGRPVVVVVDEAHHAVAPTYRRLLDFIRTTAPSTIMLGLTATPWPHGQGMTKLLQEMFPTTVASVDPLQLIDEGHLARPVIKTVTTSENLRLADVNLGQITTIDMPDELLERLNDRPRNELIVQTWSKQQQQWGKTLVFACNIKHANALRALFARAGATVDVVHSQSEAVLGSVLQAFRDAGGPRVLISVGMLLEGVDLPSARTAFLARPTRRRVLMRQMIGRVLRGPKVGGDPEAYIVDFRDNWVDDIDVLSPLDLEDFGQTPEQLSSDDHPLRRVKDDAGDVLPEWLTRRIEEAFARARVDPRISVLDSTLVGYWQLAERNVPVFDATQQAWDEVVDACLAGGKGSGGAFLNQFGDLPAPRPSAQDVTAVVNHIRSTETRPPFVGIRLHFNLRSIAQDLLSTPAMTESEKLTWQRERYETTLARSMYPTLQGFAQDLHQQVWDLVEVTERGSPVENADLRGSIPNLPALSVDADRELKPVLTEVIARARAMLDAAGEEDYSALLYQPPRVQWTFRPGRSSYAYWNSQIAGKAKGAPVIRVNRVLQAPKSQVSDELLQCLVWHELCHHLLPGRGHDAEFYRLLVMWPNFAQLDQQLDKLPESWDLDGAVPRLK